MSNPSDQAPDSSVSNQAPNFGIPFGAALFCLAIAPTVALLAVTGGWQIACIAATGAFLCIIVGMLALRVRPNGRGNILATNLTILIIICTALVCGWRAAQL